MTSEEILRALSKEQIEHLTTRLKRYNMEQRQQKAREYLAIADEAAKKALGYGTGGTLSDKIDDW